MFRSGIRVLCIGDHAVVREGLGLIIDMQSDMTTIGCGAVRDVAAGKHPIPAEVAMRLAARTPESTLTQRETDVLSLLAQGMRNKEIGARLGITEETAHGHIKNIFQKLKVQDRTAAVTVGLAAASFISASYGLVSYPYTSGPLLQVLRRAP